MNDTDVPVARKVDNAATALGLANHATFRGLLSATDAYDVVGSLDELVRRLTAAHNHLGHLGRHTPED